MIQKPPHGDPCNNCGQCCQAVLCPLAQRFFGGPEERSCPALEQEVSGRFTCGLIAHPMVYAIRLTLLHGADRMAAAAAFLVGAGHGCDAQLEGERANEQFRAAMWKRRNPRLAAKHAKLWGVELS